MTKKDRNLNLRTELGFGKYKDKKITDFDNNECDYLLWALKTVRIPNPLRESILEYLDTKVILNTQNILDDKSSFSKDELKKIEEGIKLDFTKFLEPRIEPNNMYECDYCNENTLGRPEQGYVSDIINCENCNNTLRIYDIELRFYFGCYKGWKISDFEMCDLFGNDGKGTINFSSDPIKLDLEIVETEDEDMLPYYIGYKLYKYDLGLEVLLFRRVKGFLLWLLF